MPNLIPLVDREKKSSPSNSSVMSPQLQIQFHALQKLHNETKLRSRKRKSDGDRRGTETEESTLASSTSQSMSQQASSDDSHEFSTHFDSYASKAHPLVLQMAMSTAIKAQAEIDILLNGIAELESMADGQRYCGDKNQQQLSIDVKKAEEGQFAVKKAEKVWMTIVDNKDC